ncbi:MAG: hypothetical protein V5A62_13080 [Haloarculaceae archaeon]
MTEGDSGRADGSGDDDPVRDLLLEHSDHRAVRAVFDAHSGTGSADSTGPRAPADPVDLIEAMRITDGELALVARDGAADVYVRWNPRRSRFEHLALWPPWTLAGYDHADRDGARSLLDDATNLRPVPHDETPFASPGTLASLGDPLF